MYAIIFVLVIINLDTAHSTQNQILQYLYKGCHENNAVSDKTAF